MRAVRHAAGRGSSPRAGGSTDSGPRISGRRAAATHQGRGGALRLFGNAHDGQLNLRGRARKRQRPCGARRRQETLGKAACACFAPSRSWQTPTPCCTAGSWSACAATWRCSPGGRRGRRRPRRWTGPPPTRSSGWPGTRWTARAASCGRWRTCPCRWTSSTPPRRSTSSPERRKQSERSKALGLATAHVSASDAPRSASCPSQRRWPPRPRRPRPPPSAQPQRPP